MSLVYYIIQCAFYILKVPVKERFFENSEAEIMHEYQFDMDTEPGKRAFNDTVEFLENFRK